MMSCMFVLIFIPNINNTKQYNININNLNFDDNNILINLFEVYKISIMQLNDNKIELSSKMQVIIYPMN